MDLVNKKHKPSPTGPILKPEALLGCGSSSEFLRLFGVQGPKPDHIGFLEKRLTSIKVRVDATMINLERRAKQYSQGIEKPP